MNTKADTKKSRNGCGGRQMGSVSNCDDVPTREEMIAVAAYFKAEQRGFAAGNELHDWLEAEAELVRSRPEP